MIVLNDILLVRILRWPVAGPGTDRHCLCLLLFCGWNADVNLFIFRFLHFRLIISTRAMEWIFHIMIVAINFNSSYVLITSLLLLLIGLLMYFVHFDTYPPLLFRLFKINVETTWWSRHKQEIWSRSYYCYKKTTSVIRPLSRQLSSLLVICLVENFVS